MQLRFEREIAAPSSLVWTYLCEPKLMSRWSKAPVKLVSGGQNGHAGGPGAHRRVFVKSGGRTIVLDEVIRDSQPGQRLVYQVVDNAVLTSHLGTITLREEGGTTALLWEVTFTCLAPGLAAFFARILRRQLGSSLDTLKAVLEADPGQPVTLPSWGPVPAPTDALWRQGEHVLSELRALADTLDQANDPKRIFPHIYSFVSEGILQACRDGGFVYPAWALQMLPVFYEYYLRNYERWCGLQEGPVESHWRRAFRVLDGQSARHSEPAGQLLAGLVLSVHAHVESDLPRSFAEVYVDHFADTSDYNRFRGDYYCMGQIFVDSFKRVQELIPGDYLPAWARVARRVLPESLMQNLAYSRAYDLPKRRRAAFRRGAELAEMLLVRAHRPAAGKSVPN